MFILPSIRKITMKFTLIILVLVAVGSEIPDGSGHRTFWMGLNDLANEGVFRWISNGKVTNFTNWHINEPNNNFAGVPEHCVEFYLLRGATKWNDRPCVTWKSRFV
ncbi:hypothetical protein B566_EDAN007820, partial [Ephemera danica]